MSLFEGQEQYCVSDFSSAAKRDRLDDVLKQAGADVVEPILDELGFATRVMMKPSMIGYVESNGFTVKQETPVLGA